MSEVDLDALLAPGRCEVSTEREQEIRKLVAMAVPGTFAAEEGAFLLAEIDRLREELISAEAACALLREERDGLEQEAKDRRAEAVVMLQEQGRLRGLLRVWGGHRRDCAIDYELDWGCNCGWADVERELAGPAVEGSGAQDG